jgi:hypothetical protein
LPRKNSGKTPSLRTPKHGGGKLLRGGKPGNKGGGRRPQKFSTFMKSLRDNPDVHEAITKAATDHESRGFGAVVKLAADYDEDKPKDQKELSGELVIRVVRDTNVKGGE